MYRTLGILSNSRNVENVKLSENLSRMEHTWTYRMLSRQSNVSYIIKECNRQFVEVCNLTERILIYEEGPFCNRPTSSSSPSASGIFLLAASGGSVAFMYSRCKRYLCQSVGMASYLMLQLQARQGSFGSWVGETVN